MTLIPDSNSQLEKSLRHLPDKSPPQDLQRKILTALPDGKARRRNRWNFRMPVVKWAYFSPARQVAMAIICLAVGFYGGLRYDHISAQHAALLENPPSIADFDSAESTFYLGRSLLSSGKAQLALEAFRKAESIRPDRPHYVLWQAVASNAIGDSEGERTRYEQLVQLRPDLTVARLNLAHNLLESGMLTEALDMYNQVLARDPGQTKAMYNRALILHMQNKQEAESDAWKRFLDHSRTGLAAQRALRHLHETDDYSYNLFQIGYRAVILNQGNLLGSPGPAREREVRFLASQTDWRTVSKMNIVVFDKNDREAARKTAIALRQAIMRQLPEKHWDSLRISWFDDAEQLDTRNKGTAQEQGVLIFASPLTDNLKENAI